MPKPPQQRLTIAERRARVAEMLLKGHSITEIARELGVGVWTASRDAKSLIDEQRSVGREAIEEWKKLETARLDKLQAAAWPKAIAGDLSAIQTVLKVMERRAKLVGLDAPIEFDWKSLPTDQLIELFNRLEGADAVQSGGADPS